MLESLHKIRPLSKTLRDAVVDSFDEINVDKKTALVQVGDFSDCLWFLADGIVRSVVRHDDKLKETTTRIMLPGHIIVSVLSYYRGLPAIEEIVTLTACCLFRITKEALNNILDTHTEFERHVRILTEDYACQISRREDMLRHPTPNSRYAYNQQHFGEFTNLIPVEYAASFANMDRTTYTSIRSGKYPKPKKRR